MKIHATRPEWEERWQALWEQHNVYSTPKNPKKGKYVLDMFPYPSAHGLHVGHPEGYTASDIYARYLRHCGEDVLHPMGFDSFGLPAENYAIKTGTHPSTTTAENIDNMRKQIKSLGFSYDWEREVITSDPSYYKWTQWIFIKLFEAGLAYEADAPINWCSKDKTGLANEEVVNGKCERCGTTVTKKKIKQWLVKITDEKYIDRLLNDLKDLDWPENIKDMQRNWIGRSEGAEVDFQIQSSDKKITVFTTRPDTLFGATYMVLSPEHPLVHELTTDEQKKDVDAYCKVAATKSDLERTELSKEKTGVFSGAYAVNPANNKAIPIWIADYVLASYGTGAIMAVPAHDSRDFEFAKKFSLKIIPVVLPIDFAYWPEPPGSETESKKKLKALQNEIIDCKVCYTGKGYAINSGDFNGLQTDQFKKKIVQWLEKEKKGESAVNYKMRDWLFSRQRYWGEPIPIVHCEKCGNVAVFESELPLTLPEVEKYEPTGTGESPLANIHEWVNTTCPKCGGQAKRETNTMPQWAGSNWYFLRYTDPHNDKQLADPKKIKEWMPVDMYIGGAEHAVLHLLYARFIYKFLFDIKVIPESCGDEPFKTLKNQGLILGEDMQKMSKSRGNVVNPDDVINTYGADVMRVYEMFMGPFEDAKPWSMQGMVGVKRFLDRVRENVDKDRVKNTTRTDVTHQEALFVASITKGIENFRFNTCVSTFMKWINTWQEPQYIDKKEFEVFLILLSPFAPHLAEELWQKLHGGTPEQFTKENSVTVQPWPTYDQSKLQENSFTLVVMINGKKRDDVEILKTMSEEEIQKLVLGRPNVKKWIDGKKIKMERYIPEKIYTIVVQ